MACRSTGGIMHARYEPARAYIISLIVVVSACEEQQPSPPDQQQCSFDGDSSVDDPQILFGDLHVHSTESFDAAITSLPLVGGGSGGGPRERCDFARFCSQLDFWSINDHTEEQVPQQWRDTLDEIRRCNELEDGYGENPSMVSYMGWEWTPTADSPYGEWGHKNVVYRDTCDDSVPARPIAAPVTLAGVDPLALQLVTELAVGQDEDNASLYRELYRRSIAADEVPACDDDVSSPSLPPDCRETAKDPATLYRKLDEWGLDALVIPHGNTWGNYHGALSGWKAQLNKRQYRADYERLVEIYSGHGNGEEYRSWRAETVDDDGTQHCPQPTEEFEPCCFRAGEIVRASSTACQSEPGSDACGDEVNEARSRYLAEGVAGFKNTAAEDWLDCGQCRDCFQPAFKHRPLFSTQAALAMTSFDEDDDVNYRFGFVGSTDSHQSGPGAGYREDKSMSDMISSASEDFDWLVDTSVRTLFPEYERQNSFFYTGGLVAVHSRGRDRNAIWQALKSRHVYATSGERILLWFDLVDDKGTVVATMGDEVEGDHPARFRVRALGAFEQRSGCPTDIVERAPEGFIDDVCRGHCYNPGGSRHAIDRIEIVKITPQVDEAEPLDDLIVDPYRVHDCTSGEDECSFEFVDDDTTARSAIYYARAVQTETPMLNADPLRCQGGADGECVSTQLCVDNARGQDDNCLSEAGERAWSSPIYVTRGR